MNRWSDLSRPPLQESTLARGLVRDGLSVSVRLVQETGSTNSDLRVAALEGAPEGEVLLAEVQTGGRGRRDRTWSSPPNSGLTFSVLLRPDVVPAARWGWLPLLTGVATASALMRIGRIDVGLKWPNDLLVGDRKLGGILVERVETPHGPPAAVVGIGINVSLAEDELPVPTATSLLLAGSATTDRLPVFRAVVRELMDTYASWRAVAGDPDRSGLREAYTSVSRTLGSDVRVELPGDRTTAGRAEDLDEDGALVVATDAGRQVIAAGDVVHLRGT